MAILQLSDSSESIETYEVKAHEKLAEVEKNSIEGLYNVGILIEAANFFKLSKNWAQAGESFLRAIELQSAINDPTKELFHRLFIASNYAEAGMCFKKVDLMKAVDCYLKRANIYISLDQFYLAAKEYFTVAEIYESNPSCYDKLFVNQTEIMSGVDTESKKLASLNYELAEGFFDQAGEKSRARECRLKVAMLATELENYVKAAQIFEDLAIGELHPLFKPLYITHLFYAMLCNICNYREQAAKFLERYKSIAPAFETSPECKFVEKVLGIFDKKKVNIYTNSSVQKYLYEREANAYAEDRELTQWEVDLIDKIRNTFF